ncbi:hypothetical protein B0H17DRAFT_1198401 [Mycena rosella]|uniref:Uncharacterized protein n=1 Tax=Mycena rosella TaxID=1033263 RepID=A0AAD7DQY1_MYCRO|nr:hypothetical protein B0H17DRAFT_1198401 [Mycena rosella]
MRVNAVLRLAVILALGSVASHVSAVPNPPLTAEAATSNTNTDDAHKPAESYPHPRPHRSAPGPDKNYVPFPRPDEPAPPPPSPATSAHPKAHADQSSVSLVHRGTELVYDPIDSSYSEVSITPWWARGEEGLSWRRDEVTGELVPQSQGAAERQPTMQESYDSEQIKFALF